jgi:glyoxylase-like metal-dependent hydrolase (beta-lactamase superfamily II)
MPLQIHTVVSEPFAENSYILWQDGRTDAVVIDPGFEPEPILEFLAERGLKLAAIVNTHGHVDHIAGNADMKRAFLDAPIVVGERDAIMLVDAVVNMSEPFGVPVTSPPADRLLHEGDRLDFAGIEMDVFDVPGHSPGHVVYVIRETNPITVMGGDVLFRGSVGRVDFPGGSMAQLKSNIERVLWPLPDGTVVYPGHGPTTTIGHEKRTNPYVGAP